MRFHETIQNAWENEKFDITDTRRHVNPMPPLSTITVTQPDWLQEVLIAEHEHEHKVSLIIRANFVLTWHPSPPP